MNGLQEEGFTLHWGCLISGAVLTLGAVVVLLTLGWRWLWLVLAAGVAFWGLLVLVSVVEDRWRAVTSHHVQRGVPDRCPECGAGWDVVVCRARFRTRCPMCGHRATGQLSSAEPPPGGEKE